MGDCPNAPTTEGSYYNYFASKHGWLISIIAINCSYKSELYTSVIKTDDGINWNHGGWNKNVSENDLESKLNNSNPMFNGCLTSSNLSGIGNLQVIHPTDDGIMYVGNPALNKLCLEVANKSYDIASYFENFENISNSVNNLESKFNNLFTQDGNTLTINY